MYFRDSLQLSDKIRVIQTELTPKVQLELKGLSEGITPAESNNVFNLKLYIIINKLSKEFESMDRLISGVFIPAIKSKLEKSSDSSSQIKSLVIEKSHQRIKEMVLKMRSMCNEYYMEDEWTEDKKNSCLYTYRFEQSYLKYWNFVASNLLEIKVGV